MLFYLRSLNGSLFYLLKNKEYSVGRKECDILILNDQSISRKHAMLIVSENNVILQDCGSRYNTFVNNSQVKPNVNVILENGNTIRFGVFQTNYTFHQVNIVTTSSSTRSDRKAALTRNIDFLGGILSPNWNNSCTHVTAEELVLTVKVLSAIIIGMPVVNLKYWEDYVECVKRNELAPSPADYKPPCSEVVLNYQNICMDFKSERRILFKNKIFIFPTKRERDKMVEMIRLAGGEGIAWDTSPVTKDEIINSSYEYIILQTTELDEKKINTTLLEIIGTLAQMGKRTIPLQEIALAIITCSCEKDCNPNFDRKGTVLAVKSQPQPYGGDLLVNASESQDVFMMNVKTETIVPTSHKLEVKTDEIDIQEAVASSLDLNLDKTLDVNSFKREGDVIINDFTSKRIKTNIPSLVESSDRSFIIDNAFTSKRIKTNIPSLVESSDRSFIIDNAFTSKRIKTNIPSSVESSDRSFINIVPTIKSKREVEEKPKKSLFAFKSDTPTLEETGTGSNDLVLNPFVRKRKLVAENLDDVFKKPNRSTSLFSNKSFLTPIPKADTLPKSRHTNKQEATHKAMVLSSTVNNENLNSFNCDISSIHKKDSLMDDSIGWMKVRSNKSHSRNNNTDEIDEELIKFMESFKNTLTVEKSQLLVRKPCSIVYSNGESLIDNNIKNFKRFKKVPPLKEQTRIVSISVKLVCNDKSLHQVVDEPNSDDDDDDDDDMQIKASRGTNRFRFRF